jgi:hypothetical protein
VQPYGNVGATTAVSAAVGRAPAIARRGSKKYTFDVRGGPTAAAPWSPPASVGLRRPRVSRPDRRPNSPRGALARWRSRRSPLPGARAAADQRRYSSHPRLNFLSIEHEDHEIPSRDPPPALASTRKTKLPVSDGVPLICPEPPSESPGSSRNAEWPPSDLTSGVFERQYSHTHGPRTEPWAVTLRRFRTDRRASRPWMERLCGVTLM